MRTWPLWRPASAEGGGVAAVALATSGAIHEALEAQIEARSSIAEPAAEDDGTDPLPFTPRAARLLSDLARAEASTLGHNYVGTEHLLLALLRQPRGAVEAMLAALGVDADRVRTNVLQLMSGHDGGRKPPPPDVTPG